MKKCPYCAKEIYDAATFCPFCKKMILQDDIASAGKIVSTTNTDSINTGSILIIAAGAGLILGALMPWAHILTDGEGWLYGIDGVGKFTALIALPLFVSGIYHIKSPDRVAGIVAIILGLLATVIGISKLIDPGSIVEDTLYADFSVGIGLYLTVLAGLTGIVGGVVRVLPAKVR